MKYEAVVIGSSSGGLEALQILLTDLPADFPLPIIIVQHIGARSTNYLIKYLNDKSNLEVIEADPAQQITKGKIYVAPANYHLLIEEDYTFSLIIGDLINYCRPAIDPLFETAAEVVQDKLIGIILTGANQDGSQGLKKIKKFGGLTVVQNPKTAYSFRMPQAASKAVEVDYLLELVEIKEFLISLSRSDNDE